MDALEDFETIQLTSKQVSELDKLIASYGSPSIEVTCFLEGIIQEQIIIQTAMMEKKHARIH